MAEVDSPSKQRTVRKRPRPVISCLECRRKKLKCDRLLPCQQCLKIDKGDSCSYAAGQEPERRTSDFLASNSKRARKLIGDAVSPSSTSTYREIDDLQERVRNLENALRTHNGQSPSSLENRLLPQLSGDVDADVQGGRDGEPHEVNLDINWSSRQLFQHFEGAGAFLRRLQERREVEEIASTASEFRAINQAMPHRRDPEKLSYVNIDDVIDHMLRQLPGNETCLEMVGVYFRNFEHSARVLHKPTFMTQYELFQDHMVSTEFRDAFVPTLLAVVSIASSLDTLATCVIPQLHEDDKGVGPVQLLQKWLELIPTKDRLSITALQIKLLIMKPQKSQRMNSFELWQWSGDVLRHAMILGLHNEPPSFTHVLESEMRRRLWVTIVEQDLFLSIACGMPTSCPPLRIRAPLNVDDHDISESGIDSPTEQSLEIWTDGSCQNILAQSFNDRLQAVLLITGRSPPPYHQVLNCAKKLEDVISTLPQKFRLHHITDEASNTPGRLLAKMEVDFYLRRPLLACYLPFGRSMPYDDRYMEARILWIQSLLYSLCFQDLFDPRYPMLEIPRPEGLWDFFYNVYGWEIEQGMLATCLELDRLKRNETSVAVASVPSIGGAAIRPPSNVKGWNSASLTKSLEDTLHPLIRRVGREGSNLSNVIRWTIIAEAAKFGANSCDVYPAIIDELQTLAVVLRANFQTRGVRITSSETHGTNDNLSPQITESDVDWLVKFIT